MAAWAETLPATDPQPIATQEQIENHLEFLASALPSRKVDTETGKRRFAVYVSMLHGLSDPALQHMSREACRTLDWFPTPKQCLDLAGQYRRPEAEKSATLRICARFAQDTMEGWMSALQRGEHPTPVEERWCRIAVERGLMIRLADDSFVSRALYHGPFKRYEERKIERPRPVIPNADTQRVWDEMAAQRRHEEDYGGDVLREAHAWNVDPFAGQGW